MSASVTTALPVSDPETDTQEGEQTSPRRQPPYHVVLLDDDDHTYEYVILMLQHLFGYPPEKGFQLAREVDTTGRVVVATTTKEHAELKQSQILSYGPDPLLPHSKGSMGAIIEPAE